jgi:Pentapeptide repeats (8 copies)
MNSSQLQQRYASGDRTFQKLDLSGLDLSGLDLRDADFSGSDLYGAKLTDSHLTRTNFSGKTNLAYADLRGADLSEANLSSAILIGANLEDTVTQGALYDDDTKFPVGFDPIAAGAVIVRRDRKVRAAQSIPSEIDPVPEILIPEMQQEPALESKSDQQSSFILPFVDVPTPYSFETEIKADEALSKQIEAELLTPPVVEQVEAQRPNRSRLGSRLGVLLGLFFIAGGCLAIVSSGLNSWMSLINPANPFINLKYPRSACGDPLPSRAKDFPVKLYPTYVRYSSKNLTLIKTKFCKDAFVIHRRDLGTQAIQVASFSSAGRAQQFAQLMLQKVGSGSVGQPTRILQIK